jgi:vacuolar-type H+-ATPase subunit E/Vma4
MSRIVRYAGRSAALTSLALATFLLVGTTDADAKSILRKIKSAGNSAVNTTSSAVTHGANTIAATATNELNAASSLAKQTYATSAQEVTSGYNASVAALNAAMNQALLAAYKQVGNAMLSANRDKVTRLANTFRNLDDEGLAALNRIVDAITAQQMTDTVNADMQVLGRKLGLQNGGQPGANVPNALANSNFGVQVDTTMGLGLGWGQSYAIGMNVVPTNGRFRLALLQAKSVSVGLQADDSVGVSLFWSPGSIDDSNGNSVGLALELAADGGAAVGMSWPAVTSFKDLNKISPVPGLSLALVGGDSVKVDLVAGYTKVVKLFQLPPAPKSASKTAGGGGGAAWDDSATCGGQHVNGFRVRSGGAVDALQFSYGSKGWADQHGANGAIPVEVMLAAGEYVVSVDYRSGARLDQIKFTTNLNKVYGPYGGGGGTAANYTVTPGERLGCMAGRSGSSIDQLTFMSTGSN